MTVVNPQAVFQNLNKQSSLTAIPAPIGGWNTRDSLSAMEPTDAVILDNFFPQTGSVKSRGGYESFSTGYPSEVETITEFNSGLVQTMIAASGSKVYTVNDSGTETEIGTGFANARWQTANFNTNLLMYNGGDTPQTYDGSTLSALTITLKDGGGSTIIGTTSADMDGVNVFKNRVYIWKEGEQRFFVGATNAIQGDFTEFPLSRVSQLGGGLTAMGTITRDGGAGEDDLACFIMSTGEVIIYNGDDPNTAADWSLEGRYKMPRPVSIRGITQYKGDLKVITESDFSSVLETIASGGLNVNPSKLTGAVNTAFSKYSNNYGWEAVLYTRGDMLIMNVPIATNATYNQYVVNTVTGAAARFTNQNARTFGIYKGELYFGGSTEIFKADTGFNDNTADIPVEGQTAFTIFGSSNRKQFIALKHIIKSAAAISISLGIALDYGTPQTPQATTSTSTGTQWDVPQWDTVQWASELSAQIIPFSLSAQGVALSNKINIALRGDSAEWFRVDYNLDLLQGF